MAYFTERIDKIKSDAIGLRREVKELNETIQQQNEMIIEMLTKHNNLLENASTKPIALIVEPNVSDIIYGRNVTEMLRRFPLQDLAALAKYEKELNEENMQNNINIVSNLLAPHGLIKNLGNVISDKIIMAVNVDGNHNKSRLLDYAKFIDVLYNACDNDHYPKKNFLNDLRHALRISKNRCHKSKCAARQKLRECFTEVDVQRDIVNTEQIELE
ncbi:uncharacterized protein [Musca autumnalis]|uniref:uncharacterized protein n=1 Tax=Musca autumnalis TaxID=221902 RepID=UPI003CE7554B